MIELITDELIEECYLYCYKKIYNKNDAEDLAQTILLEVVCAINNKKPITNFYAWFWGLARNQILLYFKFKVNKPVLLDYESFDSLFMDIQEVVDDKLISKVRTAITKISEIHRSIIISYYLKNLSIREIATNLSISESAVKKRLFDARTKIKKEIINMEKTIIYDIPVVNLWGSNNWPNYWMFAETKIRKSILAICYDKELTLNEISEFMNINPLYLEDDINVLVDKQFLLKTNNKYETNIILYKKSNYDKYRNAVYQVFSKLAEKLNYILDKHEQEIIKLFNTSYQYDELKWAILPHICGVYSNISNNVISKNYGHYPKVDRSYYCEGTVQTSTDEVVQRVGHNLGWSNIHYNYITSNGSYIGTSDMFESFPFATDRTKMINESNIDIIDRVIKGENPVQSKKDEILYSELIKHKIIVNNKLAITHCQKKDWYQSFYSIIKNDLDSIVDEFVDIIEPLINQYLLPMVKKSLYGDFYDMGIKSAFFPINVVARIAYDNKWIKNVDNTNDIWYGVTIFLG